MKPRGVLFINLGTTSSATPEAVGSYLKEFLMDPWVIDLPNPWRWLLVNGVIVPRRRHHSAEAYRSIWMAEGSPFLVFSQRWFASVRAELGETWAAGLSMRYGEPSVRAALEDLRSQGIEELAIFPLYPQFADSSTTTALEKVSSELRSMNWRPQRVRVLDFFFDQPKFLECEAKLIASEISAFAPDHLLLSYHGLPERHLRKRSGLGRTCKFDQGCCSEWGTHNRLCYRAQCLATSRGILKRLPWTHERTSTVFQSRLGRARWIGPSLTGELQRLAENGCRRVLVACPSFVVDCLETIEEVGLKARELFRSCGGEELRLVPSLNANENWVRALPSLLNSDRWHTQEPVGQPNAE